MTKGGPSVIRAVDLTKKYGDQFAIRSIDLELQRGDLFGFIGPNGAGKTTTMRILATLLNPTWGEAYLCGNSIYTKAKEIRRLVGYMPDFFGVYDDMKVDRVPGVLRSGLPHSRPRPSQDLQRNAGNRGPGLQTRRLRQHLVPRADPAAWDWLARCSTTPKCCSWTSRSAAWTLAPGSR